MGKENVGGYSVAAPLEQHDKDVFDKAMGGLDGVVYTPQQVSKQIVAGVNYLFLCTYKTITAEQEAGNAVVRIFEELPAHGGKVSIVEIVRYHN